MYLHIIYFKQIGQTLVETGPLDELLPGVAEKWSISNDRKKYTFKLRPNAIFSDGSKIDANAVVRSLNNAAYGSGKVLEPFFRAVVGYEKGRKQKVAKGIAALDSMTLVISLDKPYEALLRVLTSGITAIFKEGCLPSPICGSGPYKVVSDGGIERHLVANKKYSGVYPPKIERLKLVTDTQFLSGKSKLPVQWPVDYDISVSSEGKALYSGKDYAFSQSAHLGTTAYYINGNLPSNRSTKRRRTIMNALNLAINRVFDAYSSEISVFRLKDLYPRGMLGHDEERSVRGMASWSSLPGMRDKVFGKIFIGTFSTLVGNTSRFIEELKSASGLEAEVVVLDAKDFIHSLATTKADVLQVTWHSVFSDPQAQLGPLTTLNQNYSNPTSVELKKILEEASEASEESNRLQRHGKIADFALKNYLYLPLSQSDHISALNSKFKSSAFLYRYQPMFSELEVR